MDLFAESTPRMDAQVVAEDQYPDYEPKVDRKLAVRAVTQGQLPPDVRRTDEAADPPSSFWRFHAEPGS